MNPIRDNEELNHIKLMKKGFVFNERPEVKRVHHVTCGSVTATTTQHPKYFSHNRNASRRWLDNKFGDGGWVNCGYCAGLDSPLG
jgi:hypothetical protein